MTPVDIASFIAVLACIQAIRVMANQNRYLQEFKRAGAVRPQNSKTLSELDLHDTSIFGVLIRHRVIEEAAQDRRFRDQQRAATIRCRRMMVALPSIILGIIGVGLAWMLARWRFEPSQF